MTPTIEQIRAQMLDTLEQLKQINKLERPPKEYDQLRKLRLNEDGLEWDKMSHVYDPSFPQHDLDEWR
jgi:hypothetical protein